MIKPLLVTGMLAFYPIPPIAEVPPAVSEKKEIKSVAAEVVQKLWNCPTCNANEKKTLTFLQNRGITDKYALSTVLGNIKQESNFCPDICEGGARVPYHSCHSGGYGLIQWTTAGRYRGLGNHAILRGGNPSTLDTQLKYMVTEIQWINYERYLKVEGQSMNYYMNHAYSWLGWGIHGNRTRYAYNYLNKLTLS